MANSIRDIAGTVSAPIEAAKVERASVHNPLMRPRDTGLEVASADSAALSTLAGKLRAAISQASSLSSFRPGVVAQLKSAIANRSYKPDLNQVAARIAAVIGRPSNDIHNS
jgi:anti-sigma28 factor (negative regulator of flagellin synthesis)